VAELLDEHEPDAVALEALFFGENARSAFAVGQARGVVMLAAGQRGIACHDYTPSRSRARSAGRAGGEGPGQRMVQAVLGLAELPRPDHAADASPSAICHANHAPLRAAVARG
jgi:crossover junction endodeoxyribonuclease RuvC